MPLERGNGASASQNITSVLFQCRHNLWISKAPYLSGGTSSNFIFAMETEQYTTQDAMKNKHCSNFEGYQYLF